MWLGSRCLHLNIDGLSIGIVENQEGEEGGSFNCSSARAFEGANQPPWRESSALEDSLRLQPHPFCRFDVPPPPFSHEPAPHSIWSNAKANHLIEELEGMLHASAYRHQWRAGDLVVAENHSIAHHALWSNVLQSLVRVCSMKQK